MKAFARTGETGRRLFRGMDVTSGIRPMEPGETAKRIWDKDINGDINELPLEALLYDDTFSLLALRMQMDGIPNQEVQARSDQGIREISCPGHIYRESKGIIYNKKVYRRKK